jgi:S-adenosylmethionine-diacylgycerolhomoserine-N-methlytransferase
VTQSSSQNGVLMNGIYRHQRHIYDLTRRNYLLGRDRMIAALDPPPAGTVLELGCGTGRNLIALAYRHSAARSYGIDISAEMLKTARRSIANRGLYDRIKIAEGDAVTFDPQCLFGLSQFDRVFFSYALSMIPDWTGALARSLELVKPGGRFCFVDFGMCEGLPNSVRRALFGWLRRFHVAPRGDIEIVLHRLAYARRATPRVENLYRGYAVIGSVTFP